MASCDYASAMTRNLDSVGLTGEPGHPRRWAALAVMMVCLVVVSLDNTILNVAMKTIQQDLGATGADMQWTVNSYTLAFAALMFTFGLLGDRFGRRRVLLAGMAVFAIGSALSAWTTSPGQLITTRTLMGVGAATIFPTTLSIITNLFPAVERPRAIGLWSAAGGIGIAIGPLAGGYLLEHWWWGSIFLVNVPFVVLALVAIAAVVPDSRDPLGGGRGHAAGGLRLPGLCLGRPADAHLVLRVHHLGRRAGRRDRPRTVHRGCHGSVAARPPRRWRRDQQHVATGRRGSWGSRAGGTAIRLLSQPAWRRRVGAAGTVPSRRLRLDRRHRGRGREGCGGRPAGGVLRPVAAGGRAAAAGRADRSDGHGGRCLCRGDARRGGLRRGGRPGRSASRGPLAARAPFAGPPCGSRRGRCRAFAAGCADGFPAARCGTVGRTSERLEQDRQLTVSSVPPRRAGGRAAR